MHDEAPQTLPDLIKGRIADFGLEHEAIREALNFSSFDSVGRVLAGAIRVPIGSIPALAEALLIDPAYLLRFALREYAPETLKVIDEVSDGGMVLTQQEAHLVAMYRDRVGTENAEAVVVEPARDVIALVTR